MIIDYPFSFFTVYMIYNFQPFYYQPAYFNILKAVFCTQHIVGSHFLNLICRSLPFTWYVCQSLSHVQLFTTPWTVACQAPLSMEFSRQEYWSGLPFPSPEDLPDTGIEPRSPALQPDSLLSEPPGMPFTWYSQTTYMQLSLLF